MLLCYSSGDELPLQLVSDLKCHFTDVKLDKSNQFVHVGLEINKVPFGYVVATHCYETELLEYCEVTDVPVVCPNLNDMLVTVDSTQLDSMQAKQFHYI